jgi:glutaredoxin 2
MAEQFKPKVYMKDNCPFCFKFMLFLTEIGVLDQFEIITAHSDNDAEMSKYRSFLQEKTGKQASFPTVEIEPGTFMAESGDLIDYYADQYGIDTSQLSALPYYIAGPFKAQIDLFKENRLLKEKYVA